LSHCKSLINHKQCNVESRLIVYTIIAAFVLLQNPLYSWR